MIGDDIKDARSDVSQVESNRLRPRVVQSATLIERDRVPSPRLTGISPRRIGVTK